MNVAGFKIDDMRLGFAGPIHLPPVFRRIFERVKRTFHVLPAPSRKSKETPEQNEPLWFLAHASIISRSL